MIPMLTIHSTRTVAERVAEPTRCPICGLPCKLNEIIRSAYHVLGCVRCHDSHTPLIGVAPVPDAR